MVHYENPHQHPPLSKYIMRTPISTPLTLVQVDDEQAEDAARHVGQPDGRHLELSVTKVTVHIDYWDKVRGGHSLLSTPGDNMAQVAVQDTWERPKG